MAHKIDAEKCIGCGECVAVCSNAVHALSVTEHSLDRERCTLCGKCIKACPNGALRQSVSLLDKDGLLKLVEKQKRLYGDKAGITFSGGEPTLQGEELLRLLEGVEIHTAIETCGYTSEALFRKIVDRMDYIMYDIKLADDSQHRRYTGVSNALILKNFEYLQSSGKLFTVRTPLIPNITDTQENLAMIQKIVGDGAWEKLPYNPLAPVKYAWIGKEYSL